MQLIMQLLEKNLAPDWILRFVIRYKVSQAVHKRAKQSIEEQQEAMWAFVEKMKQSPIAIHTDAANEQHYELPASFFQYVLGKRLKYSGCYWSQTTVDLDAAEDETLQLYAQRAQLVDGQDILELGCGWGSLTLWIAKQFSASSITAVSNSNAQREYIEGCCREYNINNVRVITKDANDFQPTQKFDRVISIEMFEHMKNYQKLLQRISTWLKPDGLLFVQMFTHREFAYEFNTNTESKFRLIDWMPNYFFTGGNMPADRLFFYFQEDMHMVNHWRTNGKHYAKTLDAWLTKMDANKSDIYPLMIQTYGEDEALRWWVYWRLFFLVLIEVFAFGEGKEYIVSHYLLRPHGW